MKRNQSETKPLRRLAVFAAIAFTFALTLTTDVALARRGGDDHRARYFGIIDSMPAQGLHGDRVIAGRVITTSPSTELDQSEGALGIGSCAKVDFRNGRVHEIDSEPTRNCQ